MTIKERATAVPPWTNVQGHPFRHDQPRQVVERSFHVPVKIEPLWQPAPWDQQRRLSLTKNCACRLMTLSSLDSTDRASSSDRIEVPLQFTFSFSDACLSHRDWADCVWGLPGYFMFNRIRSGLAARRAAMLEAEALVLRHGSGAEGFARSLVNDPLASDMRRKHYGRVAATAKRRYDLFSGLDTATRYAEAARWRARSGAMIP